MRRSKGLRNRTFINERKLEIPEGIKLTSAKVVTFALRPTKEEIRRGEFRQDIQEALSGIRFTGGIFGPKGMEVSRDAGARTTYAYAIWARLKTGGFIKPVFTPREAYLMDDPRVPFEIGTEYVPKQDWGVEIPVESPEGEYFYESTVDRRPRRTFDPTFKSSLQEAADILNLKAIEDAKNH